MNNIYMSPYCLLQEYGDETYTEGVTTDTPLLVANARPLEQLWENAGNRYTKVLFKTHDSAVIVPNDADENWDVTAAETGSYPTGILGQRITFEGTTQKTSYLVAFGSLGMIDQYFMNMSALNNAEYLVNLTNLLADKEEGIQIVSKTLGTETLGISQQQAVSIGALFQYALPVVILLAGGFVWLRRRNR